MERLVRGGRAVRGRGRSGCVMGKECECADVTSGPAEHQLTSSVPANQGNAEVVSVARRGGGGGGSVTTTATTLNTT